MKVIEPCGASRSDQEQIECVAKILVGTNLIRVKYVSPQFAVERMGESHAGYDIVLKGVELSSSSHALAVLWWMEGTSEGLSFVVDPDEQFYADERLDLVDVSRATQWSPF